MDLSSTVRTRIGRTIAAAGLSLVIMFGVMAAHPYSTYAATPVSRGGTALVANTDGDTIRVRDGAGTSYDQVAEAHEGETVSILDGPAKDSKGNVWYKVSGPGGTGWVLSDFLAGKTAPASSSKGTVSVARGGTATVANTDGDTIRVRSGAGTKNDQIAEAHEGETVSILDGPTKDSTGQVWYKVSAPGGTGWMMADFLAGKTAPAAPAKPQATPAKKAAAPTGPKLTGFGRVGNSDGDPVRLRSDANSDGNILAKFSPDTSVAIKQGPVVDSSGTTWYQVSANGMTGWMMAQYLIQAAAPAPPAPVPAPVAAPAVQPQAPVAPAPAPVAPAPAAPEPAPAPAPAPDAPAASAPALAAPAESPRTGDARGAEQPAVSVSHASTIVGSALKYVGYRYRSGGVGPSSFDCSGFVYFILNHGGFKISRDMGAQWNSGTHVKSSALQPGDLVFFSNTYKRGLSHVGIYIGNGRFVHAENASTGVRISDLWSSYYAAHYTGAVRPSY